MNLKVVVNTKVERASVYIGKNGHIRFKQATVSRYDIKEGQKYLIAYDEDENEKTNLFLFKSIDENGFKVLYGNKSYFICALSAMQIIGLPFPALFSVSECKEEIGGNLYNGIKLTLNKD